MSAKLWICLVNVLVSFFCCCGRKHLMEQSLFQLILWEYGPSLFGSQSRNCTWLADASSERSAEKWCLCMCLLELTLLLLLSSGPLPRQRCCTQQTRLPTITWNRSPTDMPTGQHYRQLICDAFFTGVSRLAMKANHHSWYLMFTDRDQYLIEFDYLKR